MNLSLILKILRYLPPLFFELMFANSTISGTYYKGLEVYLVTALIYLLLTYSITRLLNYAARRLDMPASRGIPSSN